MTQADLEPGPRPLEEERTRLTVLVRLAATAGRFSPKLAGAIDESSDAEVRVMSDLVERGMSIPALVSFLQGAHVLVGDDALYQRWIFPNSHPRMSSHHKVVDKKATPDYGLEGPLVREALHGKAETGTWVQLERTATNFHWGKKLTWRDIVHTKDFVIYRLTGKNVGPWGLSAHVDTRPMVLRPRLTAAGEGVDGGLAVFARRRREAHGTEQERASWSQALEPDVEPVGPAGDLFAPVHPESAEDLLPDQAYGEEFGLGLFGDLALIRAGAALPEPLPGLLDEAATTTGTRPPRHGGAVVGVPVGGKRLNVSAAVLPPRRRSDAFLGMEEDQA